MSLSPLLLLALLGPRSAEDTPLRIGETIRGALDPPAAGVIAERAFVLVAKSAGTLTILLESQDFDASLRVEGEGGESVAEADDGGVETNARLVLEAAERDRYRVVVRAAKGGSGEFALAAVSGNAAVPTGDVLLDAAIEFRAAAAERALARGDRLAAAVHRLEEGRRSRARFRFPQAEAAIETALELFREVGHRGGEAAALANLGALHHDTRDLAKSLEAFDRSLAIAREIGDRDAEGRALGGLGNVHFALGEPAKARADHEGHLAIARERGDRSGEATALGNLGRVYWRLGEYAKAREHHEGHLAIARESGDRALEAKILLNLANVHLSLGEFARARENLERTLAVARELGDRDTEAAAVGNLGIVCRHLGDFAAARARAEEHLSLSRELGNRAGEVRALLHLGNVHLFLGEEASARECYERSLALAREIGERSVEGTLLGNLGVVHESLGDFARAREYHERQLALARDLGVREWETSALGSLGSLHLSLGDCEGARAYLERQLALARELGDREGEGSALGTLGSVYATAGQHERARDHHERHLAIAREIGDRLAEAKARSSLAGVEISLGNHGEARAFALAALGIFEELGVERSTLAVLHTLLGVAIAERDVEEAVVLLERARRILEQPPLGASDAAGWRSRWSDWGDIAQDVTALRGATEPAERARRAIAEGFEEAGRWKGRTLLEGIAEHRSGARTAEAISLRRQRREALAAWGRTLERVSEAIRDREPPSEVERLRGEAEGHRARAGDLAREIARVSPRDASLDVPAGADREAVRRVLGPRTVLVEYAEGMERLYAYVLAEGDLRFLDLGERRALRGDVEEYLALVGSLEPLASSAEIARAGEALFGRLLAPALREAGSPVERLVVVPTGALAGLPFEALVVSGRGGRFADIDFVGDRYEVSYAPSSPVLVELAAHRAPRREDRILVLADPVYASEAAGSEGSAGSPRAPEVLAMRAAPDPRRLPRLSGTREEALALARLLAEDEAVRSLSRLSADRSGSLSTGRVDLYLGASASRARLREDLRPYSVLHLAAHGYVDREFPERTGIALSFGEGEDGYFTIADALELDLDADLVVLSACETARGEIRAGEGVESLARAFLYAGARGVVASLWRVEERAAVSAMEAFYRGALEDGLSPPAALRAAKLAIRRSRELRGPWGASGAGAVESGHPFFWAPFLYVGLPR